MSSFLLFPVFLLDFFDNVVIFKIVLSFGFFLKPLLTDSEAWLFDDQVGIVFLFFDHFGGNVILIEIVCSNSWNIYSIDEFSVGTGFENR